MNVIADNVASLFGGNPFATPVGQKMEQATDGSLASENWALNMEICDMINETEDGARDAVKALRKRFSQNAGKNYTVVMYALTVLETCVKNCGRRMHVLVCSKDFIQELVKLIGPKNDPPTAVQEKVLSLIQSWADAFRHLPELHGVVQVYDELKAKGIDFPMTDMDAMAPIITPGRVETHSPSQTRSGVAHPVAAHHIEPQKPPQRPVSPRLVIREEMQVPTPPVTLNEQQLGKLRRELDIVQGNMTVMSEMLSELKPGKEQPSDLELLKDLHGTCRAMQQRLVELIDRIANDEITAELLRLNDEMNNLFLRYDRFEKNRAAAVGATVRTALTASRPAESTLIDLGPEPKSSAAPDLLETRLGNMGMGAGKSNREDNDFDMFAQSRTTSYESSKPKESSYRGNLQSDQMPSLGAAAQQRGAKYEEEILKEHTPADFADMEEWMKRQHVEGQDSSGDFERFLQQRAATVQPLPRQPQQPAPGLQKKDEGEDSLFSL